MKAKEFVDSLLKGYEESAELADFREELQSNLEAKIENLVRNGMDEGAAFDKACSELGDVWELANRLFKKAGAESAKSAESRERPASGFTDVAMECKGSLVIHPGHAHRVVVTVDDNIQDIVKTEVVGATLRISTEASVFSLFGISFFTKVFRAPNLKIDVYMPELRNVVVAGSADVFIETGSAPSLGLRVAGSGKVRAESYEVRDVTAEIAGSGNASVSATDTLTVRLTGSGNVNAESRETRNVTVKIAGSGDAKVRATEALAVKIAGSGNVSAESCETRNVNVEIMGSGNVRAWAARTLNARLAGSGSVYYKGDAALEVRSSGSGRVRRL